MGKPNVKPPKIQEDKFTFQKGSTNLGGRSANYSKKNVSGLKPKAAITQKMASPKKAGL